MTIEHADYLLIKRAREQEQAERGLGVKQTESKLALIGNCDMTYLGGLERFKQDTKFDDVHTFDSKGAAFHPFNFNEPLPEDFEHQYDWVIDSGTLYGCFDIATAFSNIVKLTKLGGRVLHTSNLIGFFGKSYFSISPALYYDFYRCNGFVVEAMGTRTKANGENWDLMAPGDTYLADASEHELQFTDSCQGEKTIMVPNDSQLCCLVKKVEDVPFTKPALQ